VSNYVHSTYEPILITHSTYYNSHIDTIGVNTSSSEVEITYYNSHIVAVLQQVMSPDAMSNLTLSLKTSETSLAVPKLCDDGSN